MSGRNIAKPMGRLVPGYTGSLFDQSRRPPIRRFRERNRQRLGPALAARASHSGWLGRSAWGKVQELGTREEVSKIPTSPARLFGENQADATHGPFQPGEGFPLVVGGAVGVGLAAGEERAGAAVRGGSQVEAVAGRRSDRTACARPDH